MENRRKKIHDKNRNKGIMEFQASKVAFVAGLISVLAVIKDILSVFGINKEEIYAVFSSVGLVLFSLIATQKYFDKIIKKTKRK